MKTIEIQKIDVSQSETAAKEAGLALQQAQGLTIKTQEGYDVAAELLKGVKARIKSLDTLRKSLTKPIDEAKARIMDLFRPPVEQYEEAESLIKRGMLTYTDEQERIRREEEARLQREADKKREEAEAKAEEARRQAEEAQKKADEARRAGDEEAARKAEAEAKKQEAKADKQEEKAATIVAPTLAPRVIQANGVSYRDQWTAIITNAEIVPNDYKIVDIPKLNKVAQATKGMITIPGVTWKREKIMSSRSA